MPFLLTRTWVLRPERWPAAVKRTSPDLPCGSTSGWAIQADEPLVPADIVTALGARASLGVEAQQRFDAHVEGRIRILRVLWPWNGE